MAFHEGFWVVTGTAAPVVALAAVVSLSDAGGPGFLTVKVDPRMLPLDKAFAYAFVEASARIARWVAWVSLFNLLLLTALLAVCLVSLAGSVNLVPPWLAIGAAVAGLLLLAVSSFGVVLVRALRRPAANAGN